MREVVSEAGKKAWFGGLSCLAFGSVALGVTAFQHTPRIAPNTFVGPVEVGSLTHEEAARRLRLWWEEKRREPLPLEAPGNLRLPPMTPGMLGVTLDDAGSVGEIPLRDFWGTAGETIGISNSSRQDFPLRFKPSGVKPTDLARRIESGSKVKPARVQYKNGAILRSPEGVRTTLDLDGLEAPVIAAVTEGGPVRLPLVEAKKRVPDDALAQITEIVSSFSTPFKPSQRDRSVNLRTAATQLDGIVLMPGESLSFNETVGKRTVENGYREAIVFEEGRQTPGVGGGICQVSSTLYNAALYANMEIVQRRNHSIPVPYVSLGRDATVYWGVVDLVLRNNYSVPLAVSADYQPGRLTFRILGRKNPGQKVVIESGPVSAFPAVVQTVTDGNLAPGTRKVRSRGSGGRSVSTWRVVYQDGRVIKREPLGTSRYRGEVQVVAVGPRRAAAPATAPLPPASATSNATDL